MTNLDDVEKIETDIFNKDIEYYTTTKSSEFQSIIVEDVPEIASTKVSECNYDDIIQKLYK